MLRVGMLAGVLQYQERMYVRYSTPYPLHDRNHEGSCMLGWLI